MRPLKISAYPLPPPQGGVGWSGLRPGAGADAARACRSPRRNSRTPRPAATSMRRPTPPHARTEGPTTPPTSAKASAGAPHLRGQSSPAFAPRCAPLRGLGSTWHGGPDSVGCSMRSPATSPGGVLVGCELAARPRQRILGTRRVERLRVCAQSGASVPRLSSLAQVRTPKTRRKPGEGEGGQLEKLLAVRVRRPRSQNRVSGGVGCHRTAHGGGVSARRTASKTASATGWPPPLRASVRGRAASRTACSTSNWRPEPESPRKAWRPLPRPRPAPGGVVRVFFRECGGYRGRVSPAARPRPTATCSPSSDWLLDARHLTRTVPGRPASGCNANRARRAVRPRCAELRCDLPISRPRCAALLDCDLRPANGHASGLRTGSGALEGVSEATGRADSDRFRPDSARLRPPRRCGFLDGLRQQRRAGGGFP